MTQEKEPKLFTDFSPKEIEPQVIEKVDFTPEPYEYKELNFLNADDPNYPIDLVAELEALGLIVYKEDKNSLEVTKSIGDTNKLAKYIAKKGLLLSNNHVPLASYDDTYKIWELDQNAIQKFIRKTIVSPLIGDITISLRQENELGEQLLREVIQNSPTENPFADNRKYLIPFTKTYNIKTNEFQEAQGDDFFTGRLKHTPIEYDISETQDFEHWLEFLLGDSKRTFLEFLGLSFINSASLSQSALVSVGNTIEGITDHGNGKSELQLVVKRAFESVGKELSSEIALSDMTGRDAETHLKPLIGALVNFDDDADTGFIQRSQQLKKLITGQAKVTGRDLYEAPVYFQNKANFWLNTNELPKLSSNDGATERRIDLLVFQKNMRLKENQEKSIEIYDYQTRLLGEDTTDLRKLMYLAIQTARSKWFDETTQTYNKETLYQSDYAKKIKGDWQVSNNSAKQFIEESDYIITNKETDCVSRTELYADYKEWAQENGNKAMASKAFRKSIVKELELQKVFGKNNDGDIRLTVDGVKDRRFYGIKLVEDEIFDEFDDGEEVF